jgi:hypothetical protein
MTIYFSIADVRRCAESAPDVASTPRGQQFTDPMPATPHFERGLKDLEAVHVTLTAGMWGPTPAWEFLGTVGVNHLDEPNPVILGDLVKYDLGAAYVRVRTAVENAAEIHAYWTARPS